MCIHSILVISSLESDIFKTFGVVSFFAGLRDFSGLWILMNSYWLPMIGLIVVVRGHT